jgi:hypothetical protein
MSPDLWRRARRQRRELTLSGHSGHRLAAQRLVTEVGVFARLASNWRGRRGCRSTLWLWMRHRTSVSSSFVFWRSWGETGRTHCSLRAIWGSASSSSRFRGRLLGVDIRGRSTTVKINYRTTHQIRAQANRLLGSSVTDVDGNTDERKGTMSVFKWSGSGDSGIRRR